MNFLPSPAKLSTWGQAFALWLMTNFIGSGIYLGVFFFSSRDITGIINQLIRDSDAQFIAIMVVGLGGLSSLPTSILVKFAYAQTLKPARRSQRIIWTLTALVGLYGLGIMLFSLLTGGPFRALPLLKQCLGMAISASPYLFGGLVATAFVYRRSLLRPGPDE